MLRKILLVLSIAIAAPAFAQASSDALIKCLADSVTGRDRKDLARWFVTFIASHPDMKDLANPSSDLSDQNYKAVGMLVTRLYTETCAEEAKSALRRDGPIALDKAFETLGQLAMAEIMLNADVRASMLAFQKYVDSEKMNSTFGKK
jgi:hypothetical protein